jgi:hypothetical protein
LWQEINHQTIGGPALICGQTFSDAGQLLQHVVDHHVGRKSRKRVTLECLWPGCDYMAKTRDHVSCIIIIIIIIIKCNTQIVSHVKRHVPQYRPYSCSLCGRAFVRKPDLNKYVFMRK